MFNAIREIIFLVEQAMEFGPPIGMLSSSIVSLTTCTAILDPLMNPTLAYSTFTQLLFPRMALWLAEHVDMPTVEQGGPVADFTFTAKLRELRV